MLMQLITDIDSKRLNQREVKQLLKQTSKLCEGLKFANYLFDYDYWETDKVEANI